VPDSRIPHPYRAKAALLGCRYTEARSGLFEHLVHERIGQWPVRLVARPTDYTTNYDGAVYYHTTIEAAFASFVNLIHKTREKENHQ
jgi:hypothetical protein